MRNKSAIFGYVLIAITIIVALVYGFRAQQSDNALAADVKSIYDQVTGFGAQMQKVSLLAPNAKDQIYTDYKGYVAPALIIAWQADPSKAPGRKTSSPWPDHIQIDRITPLQNGTYEVDGTLYYMTSNEVAHGGTAGKSTVIINMEKLEGVWQIYGYAEQK